MGRLPKIENPLGYRPLRGLAGVVRLVVIGQGQGPGIVRALLITSKARFARGNGGRHFYLV